MKKILHKILFGNKVVSEYVTITINGAIREQVYLQTPKMRINISTQQFLLCLEPVVFGVWVTDKTALDELGIDSACSAYFMDMNNTCVAVVNLRVTANIVEKKGSLILLTLKSTRIWHVSFIRTCLLFYRYYKKPQQPFAKLKAYAAAYSYPRKVSVVSFADGDHINIFPMDLVGDLSQHDRFVFGLRHTNITLERIMATNKILISEMPFSQKETIYKLASHHRTAIAPDLLPFELKKSLLFGFPVPACASFYREIRILKVINLGSHMLLWGEPVAEQTINEFTGSLYHIHFLHYLHHNKLTETYRLI